MSFTNARSFAKTLFSSGVHTWMENIKSLRVFSYEDITVACHTWTNLLHVLCASCYVKHNTDNKNLKDRPWAYTVTMRSVRATIVAGKAIGITYSESVFCSLTYPVCNAHAPYCHLWPARLDKIFPHYLTKGTIFEKKIIEHKLCCDILYNFIWNIFYSKKNWKRYDQYVYRSSCKVPVILVGL